MSIFVTIAGPQSSGKTTALEHLRKKHSDWFFIEDINPYTIAGENHPGGAYTSEELEIKISEIVLAKIASVKNRYNQNSAIEAGIFHLVFMKFFGRKKLVDLFYPQYTNLYNDLNSFIIFIDTKPEVSFSRRKEIYIERIKKMGITDKKLFASKLKKYQDIVFRLYPHWLKFYEKIPYPKVSIKNSDISKQQFLNEIDREVKSFLS